MISHQVVKAGDESMKRLHSSILLDVLELVQRLETRDEELGEQMPDREAVSAFDCRIADASRFEHVHDGRELAGSLETVDDEICWRGVAGLL